MAEDITVRLKLCSMPWYPKSVHRSIAGITGKRFLGFLRETTVLPIERTRTAAGNHTT